MTELSLFLVRLDGSKQGLGASCEIGAAFQSRMKCSSECRLLLNSWLPSLNGLVGDTFTAGPHRFESKGLAKRAPGGAGFEKKARRAVSGQAAQNGGREHLKLSSAFQRGRATWSRRRARPRANCRSRDAAERRDRIWSKGLRMPAVALPAPRGFAVANLLRWTRDVQSSQLRTLMRNGDPSGFVLGCPIIPVAKT